MATLNENSDDAEDNIEMDEDLSPELSAQLGDLILGIDGHLIIRTSDSPAHRQRW